MTLRMKERSKEFLRGEMGMGVGVGVGLLSTASELVAISGGNETITSFAAGLALLTSTIGTVALVSQIALQRP